MDTDYVIVVHGTFASPVEGRRDWFQLDESNPNNFCNLLNERLKQPGDHGPIERTLNGKRVSFSWSGANDHAARLEAAEKLYGLISAIMVADPSARVHIVAHSHGGNVVLKALEIYLQDFANSANGWYWWGLKTNEARGAQIRDIMDKHDLQYRDMSPEDFFLQLTANHEVNRIGRVVLLGTPFYEKVWRVTPWRWPRVAFRFLIQTLAAVLLSYAAIVFGWCFALFGYLVGWTMEKIGSGTDGQIPFPNLNPVSWTGSGWICFGIAAAIIAVFALRGEMKRARRNISNLYFDGYEVDRLFFKGVEVTALPFETLVINMDLLDEALLGLSAEPIVYGAIAPRIRSLFEFRAQSTQRRRTGEDDADLGALLLAFPPWVGQQALRLTAKPRNLLRPVTSLLLQPLKLWLSRAMESFVLRIISSAAFGIPPQEFFNARILVKAELGESRFFKPYVWSIGQIILRAIKETPIQSALTMDSAALDRYAFLADDKQLDVLSEQSQLYRQVSKSEAELRMRYRGYNDMDDAALLRVLRRVSITVERRLADTLMGFGHVRYYSIPQVVDAIAQFIATGHPPQGTLDQRGAGEIVPRN